MKSCDLFKFHYRISKAVLSCSAVNYQSNQRIESSQLALPPVNLKPVSRSDIPSSYCWSVSAASFICDTANVTSFLSAFANLQLICIQIHWKSLKHFVLGENTIVVVHQNRRGHQNWEPMASSSFLLMK